MKIKKAIIFVLCFLIILLNAGFSSASNNKDISLLSDYDYHFEDDDIVIDKYNGSSEDIILFSQYQFENSIYYLTKIGDYAFEGASITSIKLPNGLCKIGEGAFYDCDALCQILIPKTVTNICDYAFDDCNNLIKVMIENKDCLIGESAIGYYAITTGTGRNKKTEYFTVDDIIVVGNSNSTAEQYANSNGLQFSNILKFFPLGDVNADLLVDIRDLVCLKKFIVGIDDYTIRCDIDDNGELNSIDLIELTRLLLKGEAEPRTYHNVIFEDHYGNVIKNEVVYDGNDATPPILNDRDGYEFTGWNVDYTSISENITVSPQYAEIASENFTVSFYDYDGTTLLKSCSVRSGQSAVPPANPTKSGAEFLGWNGNYSKVNSNVNIIAVYSDSQNVFAWDYNIDNENDTVTATLSLKGNVSLCLYSLAINYDKDKLQLIDYDDQLGIYMPSAVNPEKDDYGNLTENSDGSIQLSWASSNNKTKKQDIIEFTFKIRNGISEKAAITTLVKDVTVIQNQVQVNANYNSVDLVVDLGE